MQTFKPHALQDTQELEYSYLKYPTFLSKKVRIGMTLVILFPSIRNL